MQLCIISWSGRSVRYEARNLFSFCEMNYEKCNIDHERLFAQIAATYYVPFSWQPCNRSEVC